MANLHSTREAALSVYDYLVNHPDEIPDAINDDDDMDSDATIEYLEGYLDCQSDGRLVISYDIEEHNCDSMVFDFLASHFACLQSSYFMTIDWWVNDSKSGADCGTDYYDRQNKIINVSEILNGYFASKS
jgi:hypothetical protein